MTPVLVILAGLVVAGAVAAVAAATPRLAVLGLLLALLGAGYVADPFPGPLGLGARLAGTTLGVYLVWIALRRSPVAMPAASVGWAGAAAVAGVAFVAGWLGAGTLGAALGAGSGDGPGLGTVGAALVSGSPVPRAALGAALALGALAVPQVLIARDTLRLGTGLLLLLAASSLVINALGGRSDDVAALGGALLVVFAGAGVAAVIELSIRRGGDLVIRDSLRPDAAIRHRAADDAHRPTA
ncbi:MAG TPA: hypothetical protein VES19_14495 [Candidatus Limnocylindrales bacterium]|nr:hypothetical protein [Candidatus Limnocylindrales bacterium]